MEPEKKQKEQPKEEMQKKEGAFCKYNEATERCIFNPDSSASANDDECYKTDKNRCASKKKMMKIKIKPKKAKEVEGMEKVEDVIDVVEEKKEEQVKKKIKIIPHDNQDSSVNKNKNNDFLYPDLND